MHQRIGHAVLQLRWQVDDAAQARFEQWYEDEHLRDMVSVPGVLGGRRFERVADTGFASPTNFRFAVQYQVAGESVFESPAYLDMAQHPSARTVEVATELVRARNVFRAELPTDGVLVDGAASTTTAAPIGSAILHVVLDIDPARAADVLDWHGQEHMPQITTARGVYSARRYRDVTPGQHDDSRVRVLAVYELEDADVAHSPAFMTASAPSPWRARLEGAFTSQVQVYRQVQPCRGALEVDDGDGDGDEGAP